MKEAIAAGAGVFVWKRFASVDRDLKPLARCWWIGWVPSGGNRVTSVRRPAGVLNHPSVGHVGEACVLLCHFCGVSVASATKEGG